MWTLQTIFQSFFYKRNNMDIESGNKLNEYEHRNIFNGLKEIIIHKLYDV